jgi:transposase-like protein
MSERKSAFPSPGRASRKPPLTEAMAAQYVAQGGGKCPFCRSGDLEGGSQDADGPTIVQDIKCLACGRRWYDVYRLAAVMPGEEDA